MVFLVWVCLNFLAHQETGYYSRVSILKIIQAHQSCLNYISDLELIDSITVYRPFHMHAA
jgi:hypothetical protein